MLALLAVMSLVGVGAAAAGDPVVLDAARMLDVAAGKLVSDARVIVEGARIVAVGSRAELAVPNGARIVDLGDVTLLPGLVDAHVHLAWSPAAAGERPAGADDALATLHAGFTTVRNLGSTGFADVLLRDAIAAGVIGGPRMLVSGPALGAPGGTCDTVFAGEAVVRTEEEARAKVRALVERGVDVIKYCAGGGVLATLADADQCELSPEIQRAIVAEAHAHGLKVAAHAQGPRAILVAVESGVDSIEHGSLLDEAAARAMKEHGVVLVPTLSRLEWTLAQAKRSGAAPAAVERAEETLSIARESLARAVELGVPIVCGTDATVLPHGMNARELDAMVRCGLDRAQALRAATLDAARLLGLEDEIGSVAPGKRADLIAVRGDPLRDVAVLENVAWVMSGGKVVKEMATK